MYLASDVESDGEGTDFALSMSDDDSEGNEMSSSSSASGEKGNKKHKKKGGKKRVMLKRRARAKFAGLLDGLKGDGTGQNGDGEEEAEIVFSSGLKEVGESILDKVKNKRAAADETAWEKTMREKKEKRDARRAAKRESAGHGHGEGSLLDGDDVDLTAFRGDSFFSSLSTAGKKKVEDKKKKKKKKNMGESLEDEKDAAALDLLMMDDEADIDNEKGYYFLYKILVLCIEKL